ncbi:MAG TPA: hypothetical protein VM425_17245 [Myxococcota bacterium]|nr:hypothetical protein [Myxococcota bacterium]
MDDRKEGQRFEGAIELDESLLDDPGLALEAALRDSDRERILGAYRLLANAQKVPDLSPDRARILAATLEDAEMYLDAARVYRRGAEADLADPQAPESLFRAACLLLGPALRPEPGADMLMYLVGNFPDNDLRPRAEHILELREGGDTQNLRRELEDLGVYRQPADLPVSPLETVGQPPLPASGYEDLRQRLAPVVATPGYRKAAIVFKAIFLTLAAVFAVCYFTRDSLANIDDIDPSLLQAPLQKEVSDASPVTIEHDDYRLTLIPKYDYVITGLIVSKDDYRMLGLSRGNIFMEDLCVIWGNNVKSRVYQKDGVSFEHHGNVCYAQWKDPYRVAGNELSNNHILTADEKLLSAFEDLERGDQIHISGQLVDVRLTPLHGRGERRAGLLKTSTSRNDGGYGACEIIRASKLEVLARGNPLSRLLYRVSFWLLIFMLAVLVARLVLLPVGRQV